MAFYGWPISQCQDLSTPLSVQLESGIRVIDIRLAIKPKSVPPQLVAYHGLSPQRTPFQDILSTIHQFLTGKGNREALVMSLKQEDFAVTPALVFSKLVREEIEKSAGGLDLFVLNNHIPRLGEVRGKVVLFSRFGGHGEGWEDGLGIHPTTWPDSEKSGFEWVCDGVTVRTHDWCVYLFRYALV
jgi:1-phosphatidylinositol phosphodiesterase